MVGFKILCPQDSTKFIYLDKGLKELEIFKVNLFLDREWGGMWGWAPKQSCMLVLKEPMSN